MTLHPADAEIIGFEASRMLVSTTGDRSALLGQFDLAIAGFELCQLALVLDGNGRLRISAPRVEGKKFKAARIIRQDLERLITLKAYEAFKATGAEVQGRRVRL